METLQEKDMEYNALVKSLKDRIIQVNFVFQPVIKLFNLIIYKLLFCTFKPLEEQLQK